MAGTYTATYTSSQGCSTDVQYSVSASCSAVPSITPYLRINSGSWSQTDTVTLSVGDTLKIGPHPTSDGSWQWTGPNSYINDIRPIEITNIQTTQAGTYAATYTTTAGCTNLVKITVTVD